MNENGKQFADACALNNMVIGDSVFPHKRIHKGNMGVPGPYNREPDLYCKDVQKIARRRPGQERSRHAASDHHLIVAKLKLKLRRNGTGQKRRRAQYNVDFLRDVSMAERFRVTLSNRYQILQELHEDEEGLDINSQWKDIKEAVNFACEEMAA